MKIFRVTRQPRTPLNLVLFLLLVISWTYIGMVHKGDNVYRYVCSSPQAAAGVVGQAERQVFGQITEQAIVPLIPQRDMAKGNDPPSNKNEFVYIDPPKAGTGTVEEEFKRYDDFISTPTARCRNLTYLGGYFKNTFNPKYICFDPEAKLTPGKCLVYSFGIATDWSFDDQIATHGCRVYAFDPTTGKPDHFRSPKIQFFNMGLSTVNSNGTPGRKGKAAWRTRSFAALLKELGHTNSFIDILKMDIERDEWSCIPQMLAEGTLKSHVKQFLVEIHINRSPEGHRRDYGIAKWLERQGFKILHLHRNKACPSCYEVAYVNTNLVPLPST